MQRYRDDGIGEYAIELRATGELIGDCGPAYREVEGERLLELGWDLHPDHWGHGYATEAAEAVVGACAAAGLRRLYYSSCPTTCGRRAWPAGWA